MKAELLDIVRNSPIIYKYLSFEIGECAIRDLSVGFKNPWAFNDPYDFFEGLVTFEDVPEGYREYLVDKFYTGRSEEEKTAKLAEFAAIPDSVPIDIVKKQGLSNEVKNRGVSCFSRNYRHMLMWSHYGQAHKGICIGFNFLPLYISAMRYSEEGFIALVNYVDELNPLNFYRHKGEAIIRWMKTKAAVWSYEEEIRIVLNGLDYQDKENFIINVPSECFNSVYLGSMMPTKDVDAIKPLIERKLPDVNIYKMERKSNSFRLKASLLNQ